MFGDGVESVSTHVNGLVGGYNENITHLIDEIGVTYAARVNKPGLVSPAIEVHLPSGANVTVDLSDPSSINKAWRTATKDVDEGLQPPMVRSPETAAKDPQDVGFHGTTKALYRKWFEWAGMAERAVSHAPFLQDAYLINAINRVGFLSKDDAAKAVKYIRDAAPVTLLRTLGLL